MADLLRTGAAWLAGQLQNHASREVVYSRGAQSVSLSATAGRTLLKLSDQAGGVRMVWTDRDWIIPAASLVLSGSAVTPRRGDQVRETVGATTYVYEVTAFGAEPEWRWSDQSRTMIRAHTKMVGTE